VLVESDVALSGMIRTALQSIGLSVSVHDTGNAALEALLALPNDGIRRVVLLAIDLAGLDGHTVHERLHTLRPDAFVVAFMSGRGEDVEQIRALRAGAIDYLVKPVSVQVLMAKVEVWRTMLARRP